VEFITVLFFAYLGNKLPADFSSIADSDHLRSVFEEIECWLSKFALTLKKDDTTVADQLKIQVLKELADELIPTAGPLASMADLEGVMLQWYTNETEKDEAAYRDVQSCVVTIAIIWRMAGRDLAELTKLLSVSSFDKPGKVVNELSSWRDNNTQLVNLVLFNKHMNIACRPGHAFPHAVGEGLAMVAQGGTLIRQAIGRCSISRSAPSV
jgi:hypothetical protein